jgi:hypothetical protein
MDSEVELLDLPSLDCLHQRMVIEPTYEIELVKVMSTWSL